MSHKYRIFPVCKPGHSPPASQVYLPCPNPGSQTNFTVDTRFTSTPPHLPDYEPVGPCVWRASFICCQKPLRIYSYFNKSKQSR